MGDFNDGIEKLKPCPFCGKPPETMGSGDGQRGLMIACITSGCVNPHTSYYDHATAKRVWNTRPSPDRSEARERIARIIGGEIFGSPDSDVGPATRDARANALAKADAILSAGLVPDEAAIRADEREKCACKKDERK